MSARPEPIRVGQVFGRLTVTGGEVRPVARLSRRTTNELFIVCRCECGCARHVVRANSLRRGATVSCGCYGREVARDRMHATRARLEEAAE